MLRDLLIISILNQIMEIANLSRVYLKLLGSYINCYFQSYYYGGLKSKDITRCIIREYLKRNEELYIGYSLCRLLNRLFMSNIRTDITTIGQTTIYNSFKELLDEALLSTYKLIEAKVKNVSSRELENKVYEINSFVELFNLVKSGITRTPLGDEENVRWFKERLGEKFLDFIDTILSIMGFKQILKLIKDITPDLPLEIIIPLLTNKPAPLNITTLRFFELMSRYFGKCLEEDHLESEALEEEEEVILELHKRQILYRITLDFSLSVLDDLAKTLTWEK